MESASSGASRTPPSASDLLCGTFDPDASLELSILLPPKALALFADYYTDAVASAARGNRPRPSMGELASSLLVTHLELLSQFRDYVATGLALEHFRHD